MIGAGPAGLSAARVAAKAGLEVLVVDERNYPGGQYYKQPGSGFRIDENAIDRQFAAGRHLIRETEAAGARFCSGAVVWCVLGTCSVAAITPVGNLLITAKRIILSTGAYERALPVPGWTLPGVMTTGAAQTFLRAYQTAPGRRVLIAGNGPLNLQVADELSRAGVEVAGVVELAASPLRVPHAALSLALLSPSLAWAGVRHVVNLARRRVPVYYRHMLTAIESGDAVASARIAAVNDDGSVIAGSERTLEVDAVCMNYGFLPQSELARALGCAFDYDHTTGRMQARRDDDGRSSVAEIFIAGDAGGLGGARVATDQGELAALSVVGDLRRVPLASSADAKRVRGRLRRNTRFQKALWRLFSAPHLTTEFSKPDTLICRCEEIDRQSLDALMSRHHSSLAITKKQTRAGMGSCQGRYCTTLMATLSARNGGRAPSVQEYFAPRPPLKPIPIGRLAQLFGTALQPTDINLTTDEPDA